LRWCATRRAPCSPSTRASSSPRRCRPSPPGTAARCAGARPAPGRHWSATPAGPGSSAAYFGGLPELAAERTLLLLDPRGTGGSDRPADPAAYDLEDYAGDLEALRRELGLERIDLLGHSHGGFVAMCWAGAHPDRVNRLVLASTAPRFTDAIREARMQRVAEHRGQPYFEDATAALMAHTSGDYATDEDLGRLYEREARIFAPPGADVDDALVTLARAGTNADALRHFNDHVAGAMDLRASLAAVGAPTLVITGEVDPMGTPAAQELAEALPDATLVVVPGDHFPFLEPEHRPRWSRAVLEFLAV
jgi:pimeloyl-ACP methyl ester carboxylesterase